MIESVYTGIRNLLKADTTILSLLGGAYVYIADIAQANQIPSITILQNSERSKKRTGYDYFKVRDNHPVVQIDCWSKKSRLETVKLANKIDELLVADSVANTRSWEKISDPDLFERDTRIWHKALRYSFSYTVEYKKLTVALFQANAGTGTCTQPEAINDNNVGYSAHCSFFNAVGEYAEIDLGEIMCFRQFRHYGYPGLPLDAVFKIQYFDIFTQAWIDWKTGIPDRTSSWSDWEIVGIAYAQKIRVIVTDPGSDYLIVAELEIKY